MTSTFATDPMTPAQASYLMKLVTAIFADDANGRLAQLADMAHFTKKTASARIDTLAGIKAAKGIMLPGKYETATPAVKYTTNEIVPAKYLIDGLVWQVKKPKYGDSIGAVVKGDGFGVYVLAGKPEAQAILAKLADKGVAYAAAVAYGHTNPNAKCGVCHTKLKDPKSVAAGIGPVCAKKYGVKI